MTARNPNRELVRSSVFKRSFKRYQKSGINIAPELEEVLNLLIAAEKLPAKYKDHKLQDSGDFRNCRELHIKPDVLLVYRLTDNALELLDIGSHADLFG